MSLLNGCLTSQNMAWNFLVLIWKFTECKFLLKISRSLRMINPEIWVLPSSLILLKKNLLPFTSISSLNNQLLMRQLKTQFRMLKLMLTGLLQELLLLLRTKVNADLAGLSLPQAPSNQLLSLQTKQTILSIFLNNNLSTVLFSTMVAMVAWWIGLSFISSFMDSQLRLIPLI